MQRSNGASDIFMKFESISNLKSFNERAPDKKSGNKDMKFCLDTVLASKVFVFTKQIKCRYELIFSEKGLPFPFTNSFVIS